MNNGPHFFAFEHNGTPELLKEIFDIVTFHFSDLKGVEIDESLVTVEAKTYDTLYEFCNSIRMAGLFGRGFSEEQLKENMEVIRQQYLMAIATDMMADIVGISEEQ